MSYYLLAIGGTGNKILEALVYACAADALLVPDEEGHLVPVPAVNALIVDVDAACGNTTRAKQAAEHYEAVRKAFHASHTLRRGFHTQLHVDRWNMNLARRATSVSGMVHNHRRDRLLAEALFSQTEADLEYSEGFRGHPDLGVLFFADLLNDLDALALSGQPDEMVSLLQRIQGELAVGETVRVMLVGSIFGGTGASGIPSVSRFLRERFRGSADRFILSAVLMLPYFEVPPSAADETMEIVVKSSTFLDKARTALQYYGMEGMIRSGETDERGVYDALYLLGLPREAFVTQRIYSTGSQSQENDAHLLEWLAVRCAAQFFRTGFRGAQAHNIDCYYYQWHSREVSWECFDQEATAYRATFGGLLKAAALYFIECYPTLRTGLREDDRRLLRTVNYAAPFFRGTARFTAAQRDQLVKLTDDLYRLLAFYVNWMWQVLRTLPPTLRPERPEEAAAAELTALYSRFVEVRALLAIAEAAPESQKGDEAARGFVQGLHEEYYDLTAKLPRLIDAVGGQTYLGILQAEKERRTQRLMAQRQALLEQREQMTRWEGEDARLIDPQTLLQEKARLTAIERAYDGLEDRLALVTEDALRAVEQRVADQQPDETPDALPENGLFDPKALDDLHRLLMVYGTGAEAGDSVTADTLRRALWDAFPRLIAQRVPDRVGAWQALAGVAGGDLTGEGPAAAFASFTAALLAAVVEEDV